MAYCLSALKEELGVHTDTVAHYVKRIISAMLKIILLGQVLVHVCWYVIGR